jgi:hypothetical protein
MKHALAITSASLCRFLWALLRGALPGRHSSKIAEGFHKGFQPSPEAEAAHRKLNYFWSLARAFMYGMEIGSKYLSNFEEFCLLASLTGFQDPRETTAS